MMSSASKRLLGVILCGGQSKRMGHDKAMLLDSSHRTFLRIAHDRLSNVCPTVCLSASSANASLYQQKVDCEIILDPEESFGPISGIVQSLRLAREHKYTGCLFNPVDTPSLTRNDLDRLIETYQTNPASVVCAIAGSEATRLEPLIAIYSISVLDSLEKAIENEQYSLQRVLQDMSVERVALTAQSCRNVNTPSDHSI